MQKTIYSIVVLVMTMLSMYLYYIIFTSSLRLENNKALFNHPHLDGNVRSSFALKVMEINESSLFDTISINPAEIELFLRAQLIENTVNTEVGNNIWSYYEFLLKKRPTWPYFYSGLVQFGVKGGVVDEDSLRNAVKFGPHEVKVIKSLAEILFYNWEKIQKEV